MRLTTADAVSDGLNRFCGNLLYHKHIKNTFILLSSKE